MLSVHLQFSTPGGIHEEHLTVFPLQRIDLLKNVQLLPLNQCIFQACVYDYNANANKEGKLQSTAEQTTPKVTLESA